MSDTGELDITMQEILRAIEAARPPEGPPGMTTAEIVEATGISERRASRLVRRAVKAGLLVADRALRRTIIGTLVRVPVYRPAANGVTDAGHHAQAAPERNAQRP